MPVTLKVKKSVAERLGEKPDPDNRRLEEDPDLLPDSEHNLCEPEDAGDQSAPEEENCGPGDEEEPNEPIMGEVDEEVSAEQLELEGCIRDIVLTCVEDVCETQEIHEERITYTRRLSMEVIDTSIFQHEITRNWYAENHPVPKDQVSVGVETEDLEVMRGKSHRLLQRRVSQLSMYPRERGAFHFIQDEVAQLSEQDLRSVFMEFVQGLDVGNQLDLEDILVHRRKEKDQTSATSKNHRRRQSIENLALIETLDTSLLERIFRFLPFPKSLLTLSLTSKKFRLAARAPSLMTRLDMSSRRRGTVSQEQLVQIVKRHPLLEEIRFPWCGDSSSPDLFGKTLRLAKHVRTVDLTACKNADDGWLDMVKDAVHLETLILNGALSITDHGLASLADCIPRNLAVLDLSGCGNISDHGIASIAAANPLLHTLRLANCQLLTDDALKAIAASNMPLRELDLSLCVCITDVGLAEIATVETLQNLILYYCSRISNVGVKYLSGLPLLTKLDLTYCDQVQDTGIWTVSEKCHRLQELDLYACTDIGDVAMSALGQHSAGLARLNIGFCDRITDFGLESLSRGCIGLEYIDMTSCSKVTHVGVDALARECSQLGHVDMTGCRLLNDECLSSLAMNSYADLRYVSISGCKGISDYGLIDFAEKIARNRARDNLLPDLDTSLDVNASSSSAMSVTKAPRGTVVVNILGCSDISHRVRGTIRMEHPFIRLKI